MVKLSFRWYRVVVMLVVILMGAGTLRLESVHKASASDCTVEAFSVSPNSSSQAVGTILSLYGRGNCAGGIRASRFNIDGGGFGEDAGAPEQSETWQLTAGTHTICFEIAGGSNGDWSAGASSCITITGVSNPPPPPPPPTNPVNPSVSGPNINPSGTCRWDVFLFLTGFAPNSAITVTSSYSELVCSSGQQVSSSWSAYMGTTDSSGNFTFGIVHQGTGSYTYTFRDAQGNSRSSSFNTSNSNPPPPPPQPTVNPIQPTSQPNRPPAGTTPPTQAPRPPTDTTCSNAPTQAVSIGQQVQVTSAGAGLRLREQPDTGARILRTIQSGRLLSITGGFQCGNGYRWWEVNYSGTVGWVADGSGGDHWIAPTTSPYDLSTPPVAGSSAQVNPNTPSPCSLGSGCLLRENGSNNRWWADSAVKGVCRGHQGEDWLVTYNTDNEAWKNADSSKVRFSAYAYQSLVRTDPTSVRVQVEDGELPGITLCFHGFFSRNDVMKTWVWIKP